MKKKILLCTFLASSLFAQSELDAIKEQLNNQKQEIAQLKSKNTNNSASFSQNAYLPDIALIFNMSAVGRDIENDKYEEAEIQGFIDKGDIHLPFNKNRGFNFNYAEVAMHSVVDPYFEAFANFHLHPDEFEIGEAYVQTTALPYSLCIKAGKFKSAFGRINAKHQHSWHFDAQPVIYKVLFGPDSISDAGLQLQYITPTQNYLMFGAEAMQGTNERSFGDSRQNNLYVGYIKSSVDIGEDLSILGGVSFAQGTNITLNPTDIYGIDLTLREQLGSYSALIWQSEYLQRNKDIGLEVEKQAGFYSEFIYQYNNNYATGVRYDGIKENNAVQYLKKATAMIEYKPFPMSRLRLSYSYDNTKSFNAQRRAINEVMLSLNIAAGAHGAHDY